MEFQLSDCLEVFTGDVWIKVRAKLLSDVIILIPVHNTEDVAKFWNFYSPDFDVSLNTDAEEPRIVEIHKDKFTGLGISIKGGRESGTPIIISKIFEGMTAAKTGQLHVGNTILSVNGEDMRNASHDEAVRALKRAGQTITLEVKSLPKVSPFLRRMHACEGKARLNGRERSTLSKPDSLPNVATTAGGMPTQTRTTRSASVLGHFTVASPVARQIPLQLVHIEHPVSTRTRLSLGHNISAPSTPIPSASSTTASPPSGIGAATGAIMRPDTSAAYDRCFELFSPDLTQSCLLRGSSRQQTNIWVAAISRQIQMLNQLHLDNLRQIMPQNQARLTFPLTLLKILQKAGKGGEGLRRIGWMMELVCSTQPSDSPKAPTNSTADASHSWSNHSQRGTSSSPIAPNDATAGTANVTWKPVFLAVSEDNLLLYHHAPLRLEEWQRPAHSNALIATRVVDVPPLGVAGSLRVPPLNSRLTAQTRLLDMLVFTVRTGK
nr:unnamed protein product [Spirometra erinaceieuropaei]